MKAIAICGSPRSGGNTETLLRVCLERLHTEGIDGTLIRLAEHSIEPCRACMQCFKNRDGKCAIQTDDFHAILEAMREAEIILVGSPVYFGSATPNIMALLDRAGYVARANQQFLSRKLGGPVVVARRAGQNFTYAQLLMWFMINDMVVPGSTYWNIAFGRHIGEVEQDEEGIRTVTRFAENLAWLAKRLFAQPAQP